MIYGKNILFLNQNLECATPPSQIKDVKYIMQMVNEQEKALALNRSKDHPINGLDFRWNKYWSE